MKEKVTPISDVVRRMPEHGRIRLGKQGTAAKGGRSYPQKLSTFRFTSHDQAAIHLLAELYGGTAAPWTGSPDAGQWEVITEAKEVPIALPPNALSGPVYELWTAAGRIRTCDGEWVEVIQAGPEGGELVSVPCLCSKREKLECKPKTRLSIILRDIPFGGAWRLDTGSWTAAHELPGMVEAYQAFGGPGTVRANLGLREESGVKEGKKHRWVVPYLSFDQKVEELVAGAGQLRGLSAGGPSPAAIGPAPEAAAADTAVAIAGEGDDSAVVVLPRSQEDLQMRIEELVHATVEQESQLDCAVSLATGGRTTSEADMTVDELNELLRLLGGIETGQAKWKQGRGDAWSIVRA